MAGNIKGITIEFRGDTTKLSKAINTVRKETREFDKELSTIDKALKFNPGNIDLLRQKMAVLSEASKSSEKNIEELKKALSEMKNSGVDETSAEYRELQRELVKAESKQKSYNAELRKLESATSSLGQFSQKMGDLGNKATKAGEALRGISMAAAGIDAAIGALAVKSGRAADDLSTLSKVTGISTTELQKYKAAADLVDVSVETIAGSQTKMKKSMLSASQGSTTTAQAFERLGVAVVDANGELRNQDDVFTETIAALGNMSNETERDALAMQIFGKSATELNPLIEDAGETYQRVADIFASNGLTLVDEETIQKANEFNDSLDTIKATWSAALAQVGMQLAGYLAPAMEKIAEVLGKVAGWLSNLSPQTLAIIGIIAGVVAGLAPVLIIVGKLAFAISSIMTLMSTVGPAIAGVAGPIGIAIAAIGALIAAGVWLYNNWDMVKEKAGQLKDWVVEKWTALKEGVVSAFNTLKERVTTIWNSIKFAITHPIETAVAFVKGAIDKIKGFFSGLKLELPHIKLPHFSLTGSFSLVPPSVPKINIDWYKNGGIFTSPTVFNGVGVGEAGAEAVLPLKKLWDEMDKRFTQGVTINVNAAPGMDVNALALEVERRLISLEKRRRNAWA